jgi:hypothetical protein
VCDYCDCRTLPPIAALSADHEILASIGSRVRDALARGDIETARQSFGTLVARLREHTATEERGLFAALRADPAMHEPVARLEADHARLGDAVGSLGADDDAWARDVTRVLDDLAAHIWVEEYDVFPASIVGVSAADWDRLADGTGRSAA